MRTRIFCVHKVSWLLWIELFVAFQRAVLVELLEALCFVDQIVCDDGFDFAVIRVTVTFVKLEGWLRFQLHFTIIHASCNLICALNGPWSLANDQDLSRLNHRPQTVLRIPWLIQMSQIRRVCSTSFGSHVLCSLQISIRHCFWLITCWCYYMAVLSIWRKLKWTWNCLLLIHMIHNFTISALPRTGTSQSPPLRRRPNRLIIHQLSLRNRLIGLYRRAQPHFILAIQFARNDAVRIQVRRRHWAGIVDRHLIT